MDVHRVNLSLSANGIIMSSKNCSCNRGCTQEVVNVRQSIDEDPIPDDPPPPYESPKKTNVNIWSVREAETQQNAASHYPHTCEIKIDMGFVEEELLEASKHKTCNTSTTPILHLNAGDPWALSDIEMGTKWSDLTTLCKIRRVLLDWFTKPSVIVGLLYCFVCSLDLMSSAFRLLGGKEAGEVFSDNQLLHNPICGLMIGILATVLVQSSSTSTSIVVSIVAAGILPVHPAIFIIMGANIGTSVTNTIVSLAQLGDRNEFRRAFGGATIHDMFNWLSVIILLPLEYATSYLYYLTRAIVDSFNIKTNDEVSVELLKKITKPFSKMIVMIDSKIIRNIATGEVESNEAHLLKVWCKKEEVAVNVTQPSTATQMLNTTEPTSQGQVTEIVEVGVEKCNYLLADTGLSERAVGGILLVVSLLSLCICLILMVKLLNSLLKGRMAAIIKKTLNADFPGPLKHLTGYFAICVGAGITFLVQSSSVFTSALTPLVGCGVITLERMFPLTLGSNIGTTATGILASLASSGNKLDNSIQIALCHLFFNISGILIWYPLPFMRKIPISLAKMLGNTTAQYRWFAVFYLFMMFFILPLAVFGLSLISIWALAAVGLPLLVILAFVVIVNVLQSNKPNILPQVLRCWAFLPEPLRSLDPLDRLIVKVGTFLKHCCPCSKRNQTSKTMLQFNANNSGLMVKYLPVSEASTPKTISSSTSLESVVERHTVL